MVANIRGHKGFITCSMWSRFDKDCILSASDDQSVKIWNLVNIKYKKPPSKKKKDTQLGEIIVEDEEDDQDSEDDHWDQEDKRGDIQSDRYEKFTSTVKKQQRESDN